MQRILVHEYLSGGGEVSGPAEVEALLPVGVAMRNAILSDLARLPGVAVTCAVCDRPGAGLPPADSIGTSRAGAIGMGQASAIGLDPAGIGRRRPPQAVAARPGEPAVEFVRRLALAHDRVWVVAPETGGLLARLHEAVGPARWVGCAAQAIRVASSKRATLAALVDAGVTTPLGLAAGHAGRWVVKPDDGAGTVDTRVHADRAAALADRQARALAGHDATVEPFVEGEALSVSMLVAPGGVNARCDTVRPLAFNRQRIGIGTDGLLAYQGVEVGALDAHRDARAQRLAALARDVARALPGLRGFVGFDVVWSPDRGPVVIEVNPRVTCAYVGLSARIERNLAREILDLHGAAHA